jgi:hypothetical protein
METERIALSQRERDRLRLLHEVKRKQITQIEAAVMRMMLQNRYAQPDRIAPFGLASVLLHVLDVS